MSATEIFWLTTLINGSAIFVWVTIGVKIGFSWEKALERAARRAILDQTSLKQDLRNSREWRRNRHSHELLIENEALKSARKRTKK